MNSTPISVAIAGATGKMGQEAVTAIEADTRFHLAAVLVRSGQAATFAPHVAVYTDAKTLLQSEHPDVWLDLTDANSVVRHIDLAIDYGISPVVGATGYGQDDLARWQSKCTEQEIGGIAVPNFAIGALLMMRFATEAVRFLPHVEIIELHHDGKKDAPSGTAKRTAEALRQAKDDLASMAIGRSRETPHAVKVDAGAENGEVPIHSIRLPGLVAHQEVIFGGTGETLTIRHDSLSRTSFMPGVLLACAKVKDLQGMTYGLEHLLW